MKMGSIHCCGHSQELSRLELLSQIVQGTEVLAECIPSPRIYLSPVHLTKSAGWLYSAASLVDSAVPNTVTAIIAANISDIPPIC